MSYRIWDARKLQSIPVEDLSDVFGDNTASPLEFDNGTIAKFLASKNGQGCLRGEWMHGKSASSAYWDSRGRSVVSTSYDDVLRSKSLLHQAGTHRLTHFCKVWDIDTAKLNSSSGKLPKPSNEIKHNCQTVVFTIATFISLKLLTFGVYQGKWLTILRAQWTPNPDVYPHFTVWLIFFFVARQN